MEPRRRMLARAVAPLALALLVAGLAAGVGAASAAAATLPSIYVANGVAGGASPVLGLPAGPSGLVDPIASFGARAALPSALARDRAGNIWVADAKSNTIWEYAATANLANAPKASLAGAATGLSTPKGLAFDAAGHLFVANAGNASVTEYAAGATRNATPIAVIAGSNSDLAKPQAVAIDVAGDLIVADGDLGVPASVERFAAGANGNVFALEQTRLGSQPLAGLALDASGRMYIALRDANSVQIQASALSGASTTLAGPATGLSRPSAVAVDAAGHLWVANAGSNQITEYAVGASGNAAPIASVTAKSINKPDALMVVSAPTAATAIDTGTSQVSATLGGVVMPGSAPTTYHFEYGPTTAYGTSTAETAVGAGPAPRQASANLGLAPGTPMHYRLVARNERGTAVGADATFTTVSQEGGALATVYVLATPPVGPPMIEAFGPGARGNLTPTLTISGPHTGLVDPEGIAVDAHGDVFVSDYTLGEVLEYAPGAHGDTAPIATIGGFFGPQGIAVDAAQHLLVTDSLAGRVVEEAPLTAYDLVHGGTGGTHAQWLPIASITGLAFATSVAFAPDGGALVVTYHDGRVRQYAPGATGNPPPVRNMFGTAQSTFAGVAADAAGNVFTTDTTNNTIDRFAPGGPSPAFAAAQDASGVAVDGSGRAYVLRTHYGHLAAVSAFQRGFAKGDTASAVLEGGLTGLRYARALAVAPGPTITAAPLPDASVGRAYSQTALTVAGGTPPYAWTASGLPPGLALNPATGAITGTPTAAGSFTFAVTAADSGAGIPATATTTVTLRVTPPVVRSVYVTDGARGTVSDFALDATGDVAPLFALGQDDGLLGPSGVAVDASGRAYVANSNNNTITEFAPLSGAGALPDRTIAGPATGLLVPTGIALGPDGKIYVANGPTQSITVYAAGANGNATPIRTIAGTDTGLQGPTGMTVNAAGDLWVANSNANTLTEYAPTASGNARPMATISAPAFLNGPTGIAQDEKGGLLVTNSSGNAVDRFPGNADGITVPSSVIQGPSTGLNFPYGIDIDDRGQIYVTDEFGAGITVYAADAHDDAAPLATIAGPATGLRAPQALSVQPPLSVRTTHLPHATVGQVYRTTLRAALGTRPYRWRVRRGSLPPGLHLSSAGVISGVPRAVAAQRVRIGVSDASRHPMTDSRVLALAARCPAGRFGRRCQRGPAGTAVVDVSLRLRGCAGPARCRARLLVRGVRAPVGRVRFALLRGGRTYARGTLSVPQHGRGRLVLRATRPVRSDVYRLRIQSHGHATLTWLLIRPGATG